MAYVTFAIVALFFFLNMPRIALGAFEVSNTWLILHCVENGFEYLSTLTFYRWDTVSRLLMVANSSINFLIYCTGSQQFKVNVKKNINVLLIYNVNLTYGIFLAHIVSCHFPFDTENWANNFKANYWMEKQPPSFLSFEYYFYRVSLNILALKMSFTR